MLLLIKLSYSSSCLIAPKVPVYSFCSLTFYMVAWSPEDADVRQKQWSAAAASALCLFLEYLF